MKLLGMIGGTGPESTIDYYRLFIKTYQTLKPDEGVPPVIINSVAATPLLNLLHANNLTAVTKSLLEEFHRLERAGATIGILTLMIYNVFLLFD